MKKWQVKIDTLLAPIHDLLNSNFSFAFNLVKTPAKICSNSLFRQLPTNVFDYYLFPFSMNFQFFLANSQRIPVTSSCIVAVLGHFITMLDGPQRANTNYYNTNTYLYDSHNKYSLKRLRGACSKGQVRVIIYIKWPSSCAPEIAVSTSILYNRFGKKKKRKKYQRCVGWGPSKPKLIAETRNVRSAKWEHSLF